MEYFEKKDCEVLRLLNVGDETLLYEVFKRMVFKKECGQEIVQHLQNFYLGYCSSEQHVTGSFNQTTKVVLKAQEFFLPLMSDWFIRPLYFLKHLQILQRCQLVSSILKFAVTLFTQNSSVLRVTSSEFILAIFTASQQPEWPTELNPLVD